MFKKLLALGLVAIGALTLTACNPDTGPTVEEILDQITEAMDELQVPSETSTDLTLPNTAVHDVEVTWESSNTDFIANDGTVTIPTKTEGNQTVTLTATLSLDEQQLTKSFTVTVLAATEYTDAELVAQAVAALVLPVTGLVTGNITLPSSGANGTAITWSSSNTDVVANDGTVTRPENGEGNAAVTLTATVTLNDETGTKDIDIIVKEEDPSNTFATVAALIEASTLGDIVEFEGEVSGLFDGGYFLTDGTNVLGVYNPSSEITPALGDTVYVKGEYAKYNTLFQIGSVQTETITATGDGMQPLTPIASSVADILALDSSDPLIHGKIYTITGTVEVRGDFSNLYLVDGDDAVLIYYYSLEASLDALEANIGLTVTIDVIYYTDHGTNGVMLAFQGGADDIEVATLSDEDALAADLAVVGADVPDVAIATITLPTEGPNGTTYSSWASDNTAVFDNDGTFVARGTETVTVTFTATATKGSLTDTATIEVVVPVVSTIGEVLALPTGSYFEINGTVTLESYYGFFIWDGTDNIFVYEDGLFDDLEPGDDINILGWLGEYNGLLQANIIEHTITDASNALPTAINGTVEGLQSRLYQDGQPVTVSAHVTREGSYDNVFITGAAGGKVEVYYRSNDEALFTSEDTDVTIVVYPYGNGRVLYWGTEAEVVADADGFTDLEKAQAVADVIDLGTLENVASDLTLPATFTDPAATITWETSDAAVVAADGTVTIDYTQATMATLTATVDVNGTTVTRDFVVHVIDGSTLTPVSVADALAGTDGDVVVVTGVVAGFNYKGEAFLQDNADGTAIFLDTEDLEDDVAIGDLIVVVGTLNTYTSYNNNQRELNDVVVLSTTSSDNDVFVRTDVDAATLGVLATIGTYSSQTFEMTLTFNALDDGFGYILFDGDGTTMIKIYGGDFPYADVLYNVGDTITLTFTVFDINYDDVRLDNVQLPELTDAQALLVAQDELSLEASYVDNITLPTELYGVAITWATSDATVIGTDGTVTRPASGEADAEVTLTATLTIGTETPVDVPFTVTVPAEPSSSQTVAEVLALATDDPVEAEGIITYIFDDGTFFMEDADGTAVYVDDYSATITWGDLTLAVGDKVKVTGAKGFYRIPLVDTVSAVEVLTNGNALSATLIPVPDPALLRTELDDTGFGVYYSFNNVEIISVQSYYIYFYSDDRTTGGTNRMGIVVDYSVDLTSLALEAGDIVSFDALLYSASGTYTDETKILRFAITDLADITVEAAPSNVAAAQAAASDDNLFIEGTVKWVQSNGTFIIEDADGTAIYVDDYSTDYADWASVSVAVGDLVRVTGQRGFYGVPLIDNVSRVEVISSGNALSGVVVDAGDGSTLRTAAVDTDYGKTYTFTDVTIIEVGSYYIYFYSSDGTNGGDNRMGIVVNESVDLTSLGLTAGDTVTFTAVFYGTNGTYTDVSKIWRFSITDIGDITVTTPAT